MKRRWKWENLKMLTYFLLLILHFQLRVLEFFIFFDSDKIPLKINDAEGTSERELKQQETSEGCCTITINGTNDDII